MTYIREPTYEVSFLFRKVLVPVDGSASSYKALDIAVDFAKRYGSKVTALLVDDGSLRDIDKVLKTVEEKIRGAGILAKIKTFRLNIGKEASSVASKITEEIVSGSYDLVIMSARGRTANPEIIIGSVALSVIVNSPVSVLLIR